MSWSLPNLSSLAEGVVEFLWVESIYAAVVFLIVLVLSRVAGRRSPGFQYWVWSLVFVRLVLPINLSHRWSLMGLISSMTASTDAADRLSGMIGGLETSSSHGAVTAIATEATAVNGVALALAAVWATCLVLLVARQFAGMKRVARIISRAERLTDEDHLDLVDEWRRRLGVRRCVRLVAGRDPVTPFTAGIVRPVVYVPQVVAEHRDREVLDAVLGHELAHIARWDALWMGIQRLLEAIFFFNPIVRLAGKRVDDERERLCDLIAAHSGDLAPHRYAGGLLSVLRLDLQGVGAPTMAAEKRRIHMRIENILEGRSSLRPARMPTMIITLVIGAFVLPLSNSGAANPIATSSHAIQAEESDRPTLLNPLATGRLTSSYGETVDPFSGKPKFHSGVDLAANEGTPVLAPATGVVRVATTEFDEVEGAGTVVVITHDGGWETRFYHLSETAVAAGERVTTGDVVGRVGNTGRSTGSHLHLEVRHYGEHLDPAEVVNGLQK